MDSLIDLYKEMAELTLPECKYVCRVPLSCCSEEYCQGARDWAIERWNVDPPFTNHPKLPYMGPNGCVLAPHLRPVCTIHTCDINGIGIKRGNIEWTKKYFSLRDKIDKLEQDIANS